jgi:gliding motility-associated-like protein
LQLNKKPRTPVVRGFFVRFSFPAQQFHVLSFGEPTTPLESRLTLSEISHLLSSVYAVYLLRNEQEMKTLAHISFRKTIQLCTALCLMILVSNSGNAQSIGSTENGCVRFRIVALKQASKATVSVSNTATLKKSTSLFMPTAFTPDADGVNDAFGAKGINVSDFHMEIYNRWGEIIFESDDINTQWDGSYHGSSAQQGSYIYNVTAYDVEKEEDISTSGTVALLR